MKRIVELIKKHKRIFFAFLFLLVFFAVLIAVGSRGLRPIQQDNNIEPPPVLENAFLRWFRGDNGELFATFRLVNHTDVVIKKIDIICSAFFANNNQANSYETSISVSLVPSEVRILNRAYIGALDPLAQKVICKVDSWE